MEAIQLVVPDVYLIQPRVFGDERGFFSKAIISNSLMQPLIGQSPSFKPITRVRYVMCYVAYITKSNNHRASWLE